MADIFEGVRVIDMSTNAACLCGAAWSDFGAEVIHVESMKGGGERTYYPLIDDKPGGYLWFARGMKSLTLNVHHPEAINIIKELVKTADVFIESRVPGKMDEIGLGYEALSEINPKLVYTSMSGFGDVGPMAHKGGYDTLGQAMSGRWAVTGEKGGEPIKDGNTSADFSNGFFAFSAGVCALYYAQKTGIGQHVKANLVQSMFYFNSTFDRLQDGRNIKPNGNHHSGNCPFGAFRNGRGESVVICAPQPKPWGNLCRAMDSTMPGKGTELLENPDYDTNSHRADRQEEIIPIIEDWVASFPSIEDCIEKLNEYEVPNAQVLDNLQMLTNPQTSVMGLWGDAPTPTGYGQPTFRARSPFAKFSKTPGRIHKTDLLGEHNYEILGELGYSKEDADKFENECAELSK